MKMYRILKKLNQWFQVPIPKGGLASQSTPYQMLSAYMNLLSYLALQVGSMKNITSKIFLLSLTNRIHSSQ